MARTGRNFSAGPASLDIGSSNAGLSIGNSPQWNGVRLNFADQGIDQIRGLNLTVWRANGDGPGEGRIGGIGVGARETSAITAALLMTRGESMQGLTVSAYNKWDFRMEGVAAGLLNITDELKGVQIGLLNIACSNPGWRRIFPIINWGGN